MGIPRTTIHPVSGAATQAECGCGATLYSACFQIPAAPSPGQAPSRPRFRDWRWAALAVVGLGIVLAAIGWTRLRSGDRLRYKTTTEVYDLYLRARAFEAQPA